MSVLWEGYEAKPDLRKFYAREQRLTHSQRIARRALVLLGMLTGLLLAVAAFGHRYFGWWR